MDCSFGPNALSFSNGRIHFKSSTSSTEAVASGWACASAGAASVSGAAGGSAAGVVAGASSSELIPRMSSSLNCNAPSPPAKDGSDTLLASGATAGSGINFLLSQGKCCKKQKAVTALRRYGQLGQAVPWKS